MAEPHALRRTATTAECLTAVSKLLHETWPVHDRFVPAMLTWLYAENPAGPVVGFDAWAGEELASHYAGIPIEACVHGELSRGLLSLNTVTHPRHQGQKLFTRLATRTFEAAASEGFSFVVGVANANSIRGFVEKLGFDLVSPLDVRAGIGAIPGGGRPDPNGFRRVWTRELLAWRLRSPRTHYSLRGSAVLSTTKYPGLRAVLARVSDSSLLPALAGLPHERAMPSVWLGLDPDIVWRRCAYLPVPRRVRPSPLNLIFRSLRDGAQRLDRRDVKFEGIDFDAF